MNVFSLHFLKENLTKPCKSNPIESPRFFGTLVHCVHFSRGKSLKTAPKVWSFVLSTAFF